MVLITFFKRWMATPWKLLIIWSIGDLMSMVSSDEAWKPLLLQKCSANEPDGQSQVVSDINEAK